MKTLAPTFAAGLIGLMTLATLGGCEAVPQTEQGRDELVAKARATIERFKAEDEVAPFFDSSIGYAVWPAVTAGGAGIGAASGNGVVFKGGDVIGYSQLNQGTIGFQLGGKSYAEVIFFENEAALEGFKTGSVDLAAGASGTAASAGASTDVAYANGVAVFTMSNTGLMGAATVGGQSFSFIPADK